MSRSDRFQDRLIACRVFPGWTARDKKKDIEKGKKEYSLIDFQVVIYKANAYGYQEERQVKIASVPDGAYKCEYEHASERHQSQQPAFDGESKELIM